MFSKIAFILVSLLITSQSAFAHRKPSPTPERICRQEFAHDLIKCVILSFKQKPKVRIANLRTCVVAAKEEKVACLGGGSDPNTCSNACQATYDADAATCEATFDPSICGGNVACEALYQQERANCISGAVDALNACNQACP